MARKRQINGLWEATYTYMRDGSVGGTERVLSDDIGPVSVALPAAKRAARRWIKSSKLPAKGVCLKKIYCGGQIVAYGVFRKKELLYEAGILDY